MSLVSSLVALRVDKSPAINASFKPYIIVILPGTGSPVSKQITNPDETKRNGSLIKLTSSHFTTCMNSGLSMGNFPIDVKLISPTVYAVAIAAQHASEKDLMILGFDIIINLFS